MESYILSYESTLTPDRKREIARELGKLLFSKGCKTDKWISEPELRKKCPVKFHDFEVTSTGGPTRYFLLTEDGLVEVGVKLENQDS